MRLKNVKKFKIKIIDIQIKKDMKIYKIINILINMRKFHLVRMNLQNLKIITFHFQAISF